MLRRLKLRFVVEMTPYWVYGKPSSIGSRENFSPLSGWKVLRRRVRSWYFLRSSVLYYKNKSLLFWLCLRVLPRDRCFRSFTDDTFFSSSGVLPLSVWPTPGKTALALPFLSICGWGLSLSTALTGSFPRLAFHGTLCMLTIRRAGISKARQRAVNSWAETSREPSRKRTCFWSDLHERIISPSSSDSASPRVDSTKIVTLDQSQETMTKMVLLCLRFSSRWTSSNVRFCISPLPWGSALKKLSRHHCVRRFTAFSNMRPLCLTSGSRFLCMLLMASCSERGTRDIRRACSTRLESRLQEKEKKKCAHMKQFIIKVSVPSSAVGYETDCVYFMNLETKNTLRMAHDTLPAGQNLAAKRCAI